MSLSLGKELNRCYSIRQPFLNTAYNISIFHNTTSNFVLFKVDDSNSGKLYDDTTHGIKINMFKNLNTSKFCTTFLSLNNYRNDNLDIVCQFDSINDFYFSEVNLISNETIILNKIKSDEGDKIFNDSLSIYTFIFPSYHNEFVFIIAERQHIVKKIKKKIVRSTALQIATTQTTNFLDQMNIIGDKPKPPNFLGDE